MKKALLFLSVLAGLSFAANAGEGDRIPAATVKKLDGSKVNSSNFSNDGKPIIISFWATWCKPCKKELDAIAENYPDWVKETGVKLIAISIDDVRSSSKVVTDGKMKGWEYEI
jgi:peroxiredoxin